MLKRNPSGRINFEDFSTHKFLEETKSDDSNVLNELNDIGREGIRNLKNSLSDESSSSNLNNTNENNNRNKIDDLVGKSSFRILKKQ